MTNGGSTSIQDNAEMKHPVITALVDLKSWLEQGDNQELELTIIRAQTENPWFTSQNSHQALKAICEEYLDASKLDDWLSTYPSLPVVRTKRVGLIMAGNLPVVGFHDLLSVLVSGHTAVVKLSAKDSVLPKLLIEKLKYFDKSIDAKIQVVEKLSGFDAVIATGSNHSARYFHQYFGSYPHIIRGNRNGVAILTGDETSEDLIALGNDIFSFFGLGCRNVSKIYVPKGYDFEQLLLALDKHQQVMLHPKYRNNFEYNFAALVINRADYMKNACIILLQNEAISSRVATLHYSYYRDREDLSNQIQSHFDEIQCIGAAQGSWSFPTIEFGQMQKPSLGDYADGVDTMRFLSQLDQS